MIFLKKTISEPKSISYKTSESFNWFTRSGRSLVFEAMTEADGSPSVSTIELDSVMFWEMSVKRTEDKFTLPSYWMETIKKEYSKLDS